MLLTNSNWRNTIRVQCVSCAMTFSVFVNFFSMKNAVTIRPNRVGPTGNTFSYRTHRYLMRRAFVCVWHTQVDSIGCQLNNYGSDNVSFVCRIIVLKLSKLRQFLSVFSVSITTSDPCVSARAANNECQFGTRAARFSHFRIYGWTWRTQKSCHTILVRLLTRAHRVWRSMNCPIFFSCHIGPGVMNRNNVIEI